MAFTKVLPAGISSTINLTVDSLNSVGVITATGIFAGSGTFSGNVSVAGTLTYEDVTNVDSVGIITSRDTIDAQGNVTIGAGLSVVGVSTLSNVVVGGATTEVVIDGDLRVTGIITTGTGSITFDGPNNNIIVGSGVTIYGNTGIISATSGFKGKLLGVPEIGAIDSSISDTAVDVFVYDTSKDSDGGAWRHRTSHTSWYNETLNTATRGSRREFPAVAVIVAESDTVTIYDGDDPDLPMWMVFNVANDKWLKHYSSASNCSCVTALNGEMVTGGNGTGIRLSVVRFIHDNGYVAEQGFTYRHEYISTRNSTPVGPADTVNSRNIVNNLVNDVAMTVLPSAPIDSATGLPTPTIAVATDGGVSVIKDDGTVVDINRTSDDDVHHVDLDGDRVIMFMELGAIYVATIPSADQSGNPNSAWSVYGSYGGNTSGTDHPAVQAYGAGVDLVSMKDHTFATAGFNDSNDLYKGLSILSENVNSSGNGMVAWAHTDFNTGWMHGDIKGAFLSDTVVSSGISTVIDRSVNNNGLEVFGTIATSAVATGAELVAYSGFSASNYLSQPYNSSMEFGTGDFYMMVWVKNTDTTSNQKIMTRDLDGSNRVQLYMLNDSGYKFAIYTQDAGNVSYLYTSSTGVNDGNWKFVVAGRKSNTLQMYYNGKYESGSGSNTNISRDISFGGSSPLEIGRTAQSTADYWRGSIALARVGVGFPSAEQIKKIYEDEKVLFQENAACTLYGSSDAVTALAYDEDTELLHVGTSSGRSDFQGLRRINNTTTAVTTAISASDELIAEQ